MKKLLTGLALITMMTVPMMITVPMLSRAQDNDIEYDVEGPPPYNDVQDGQLLKLTSYLLNPIGYVLEHGVAMPLHNLATNSSAAPVLSGDTEMRYFGETSNASLLPPSTFRPFQMPANPTQMDTGAGPLVMTTTTSSSSILPQVPAQTSVSTTTTSSTTKVPNSLGQTVIH
jgi:hypothetical protein